MPTITSLSPSSGPVSADRTGNGACRVAVPASTGLETVHCAGFHRQHRRYLARHRTGHGTRCGSAWVSRGRHSSSTPRWVRSTTKAPAPVSE